MAAGKSKTAEPNIEDAEILGQFDNPDAGGDDDFADIDDLLNQVDEEDSEGWVPQAEGDAIVGIVTNVGTTRSDFAKPGDDPDVPVVTLRTRDGNFRVIGYSSVLKREILDKNPERGDQMAVKYFGKKKLRKGQFAGKDYHHYGVIVKKTRAVSA